MKFQLMFNSSRQFSWRLVASNSLIIAVGVESYRNKADCRRAIDFVVGTTATTSPFVDLKRQRHSCWKS